MNFDELEKIVRKVSSNKDIRIPHNLQYGTQINRKKLSNAIKQYAFHAMDETIVALSDDTLFGSAKDGFLITTSFLYSSHFKMSPDEKKVVTSHGYCIPIDGITNVRRHKDKHQLIIYYANGNSIIIHCLNYRDWVLNILKQTIQKSATDVKNNNIDVEEAMAMAYTLICSEESDNILYLPTNDGGKLVFNIIDFIDYKGKKYAAVEETETGLFFAEQQENKNEFVICTDEKLHECLFEILETKNPEYFSEEDEEQEPVDEQSIKEANAQKEKEEAERKEKEEAEARIKAEEERKKAEEKMRAKIEAEIKAEYEAKAKAKEEAARQKAEAEARIKAEEERRKAEEEMRAKIEAEMRAKYEAEVKAKEEAARKAKEEAERKAKEAENNTDELYQRAVMYREGKDCDIDVQKAMYLFEKAAKQGHKEAQFALGQMYATGEGCNIDMQQAFYWIEQAAKKGHSLAQAVLGTMYVTGSGCNEDKKQALYWTERAAKQGDGSAQFNLGLMYDKGDGCNVDKKQALYWYEQAAKQ
ncbi:MAG: hypothetical protein MJ236_06370, partial [Clostridia bacterium]|nr:hypothetical protein [Clostridia bacterium]